MWQVMSHRHLPSIHKVHSNSWEHFPHDRIKLKGIPITVEEAHFWPKLLNIGGSDDDQSLGAAVQQLNKGSADVPEPPDVHLHGEGAEVGPDGYGYDSVPATHDAVELVGDVAQLAAEHRREADGRPVAAELQQDVVLQVHRHERAHVLRTPQVKFHQVWNKSCQIFKPLPYCRVSKQVDYFSL